LDGFGPQEPVGIGDQADTATAHRMEDPSSFARRVDRLWTRPLSSFSFATKSGGPCGGGPVVAIAIPPSG
jgi:hypothetical protein